MYFSCQENLANDPQVESRLYFGTQDGYSYVAEFQKSTGGSFNGMVLAKIDSNSTDVHVWQITAIGTQTSSWFEIRATQDADGGVNELDLSFATNEESTTGLGCGVRFRSRGDYAFSQGYFADNNCGAVAQTSSCVLASDLTAFESGSGESTPSTVSHNPIIIPSYSSCITIVASL